jgi:diguanylate cyclase (GGDEF)-like protein
MQGTHVDGTALQWPAGVHESALAGAIPHAAALPTSVVSQPRQGQPSSVDIQAIGDQIADSVQIGIVIVDDELRVCLWNRWTAAHTGIPAEAAIGRPLAAVLAGIVNSRLLRAVLSCIRQRSPQTVPPGHDPGPLPLFEHEAIGDPQAQLFQDLRMIPLELDGQVFAMIQIIDVTSMARRFRRLRESTLEALNNSAETIDTLYRLSRRDPLTGLLNRRSFYEAIETEWRRHRRNRKAISALLVDVDHFKSYNDHYGHQQGDRCLQAISRAIESATRRAGDLVVRYGGEEFCVLLLETDIAGACSIGNAVRSAIVNLRIEHRASPTLDRVTVSVGAASTIPDDTNNAEQLIKDADAALYRAKAEGRNRVLTFTPSGG